jgi:RimJ/RimL family protein N-acetyltransferase
MRVDLCHGFYLDAVREGDQPAYIEHFRDRSTVDSLLKIPYPYTQAHADFWVGHCLKMATENPVITEFAVRRADGFLVGGIGLIINQAARRAETGYWIAQEYRRRGVTLAAVQAIVRYGFGQLGLNHIEAFPFISNSASHRLLEKAGFSCLGIRENYHLKDGVSLDARAYVLLAATGHTAVN